MTVERQGPDYDGNLVGALLEGRYQVGPMLAHGGMSTVYRGTDTRLDRPVAIKVMAPRFAADPLFLQRFEREQEELYYSDSAPQAPVPVAGARHRK